VGGEGPADVVAEGVGELVAGDGDLGGDHVGAAGRGIEAGKNATFSRMEI
jgi:hypothetical protein